MLKEGPTFYHKALVAYLYFIQGIFLNIPGTTVLTYSQMPSYGILGHFSLAIIPFSFKFISAPFIEKYTLRGYGRRKTWVVASLVLASLFLVFSTIFTAESQSDQKLLALCLMGAIFMISLEDISTDALAVKELNSAELASYLQCVMQSIGSVVGSILYFELVAGSLYTKLGYAAPFLTVPSFFCCLAGLTFSSAIVIHLTYHQKINKQQKDNPTHSLWQVIKHYRYFAIPRFAICRQAITFLFYVHGLNYFMSSYTVQLLKRGVISKDLLSSIANVMVLPVFVMVSLLRKYWQDQAQVFIHKRTRLLLSMRLALAVTFFWMQPDSAWLICLFYSIFTLLSYAQFFINSAVANSMADPQYSGMFVSMMASILNFGNNHTIQLEVISTVGYRTASVAGFGFTAAVILGFGRVERWIRNGEKREGEAQKIQSTASQLKKQ